MFYLCCTSQDLTKLNSVQRFAVCGCDEPLACESRVESHGGCRVRRGRVLVGKKRAEHEERSCSSGVRLMVFAICEVYVVLSCAVHQKVLYLLQIGYVIPTFELRGRDPLGFTRSLLKSNPTRRPERDFLKCHSHYLSDRALPGH